MTIYKLRHKTNAGAPTEIFFEGKSFKEAQVAAMAWCERMRFRFIHIKPFLTDITKPKLTEEVSDASTKSE